MNSSLVYKNILITLLRDRTGRHVSGFPTEVDFVMEMSESALKVLTDQEIINSAETKLRRAADHALHSQGIREKCSQTGSFTWDDFIALATNEMLGQYGLRRFDRETNISRHVAVAVDRNENLLPDLSDGHVYRNVGRRRRRLVATVNVDLRTGSMTGDFTEPVDPNGDYVLAFKDHDELIPLNHIDGTPGLSIASGRVGTSKSA